MKLSIIIPVFNEIECIKEFTDNLNNTFINENVEYIFINDGSNDGSKEWLEEYIKKQGESEGLVDVKHAVRSDTDISAKFDALAELNNARLA